MKERAKPTETHSKSETLPEKCLFCDSTTENLQSLYTHMNSEHGFFIREKDALVDMRGLIESLRQMIEK